MWNKLSIAWTIAVGLLELVIAWILLNAFQERFEKVVIALLVMIYVTMRMIARGQWKLQVGLERIAQARLSALAQTAAGR